MKIHSIKMTNQKNKAIFGEKHDNLKAVKVAALLIHGDKYISPEVRTSGKEIIIVFYDQIVSEDEIEFKSNSSKS